MTSALIPREEYAALERCVYLNQASLGLVPRRSAEAMVAFLVVLYFTPRTWLAQAAAFALFRLFDIVKPPPIREVDARMKGGVGVMLDDLLAAAYTLLALAIAERVLR